MRDTMTVMWRRALKDLAGATTRAGAEALHGDALVRVGGRDVELFGEQAVVVDRVRDGRRQDLADHVGRFAGGAGQDLAGRVDVFTANDVEDDASLAGGHLVATQGGAGADTFVGLGGSH